VEGKAAGLRLDSMIMTDNLATILESEKPLCRLDRSYKVRQLIHS
jgi:hypothetical protein